MGNAPLPDTIPIFPLRGALLLPGGHLPLQIFEPRYVAMIEDALAGSGIIGMIQPNIGKGSDHFGLHHIGCAGEIVSIEDTEDGRFFIILEGLSRFTIRHELPPTRGYRHIRADWLIDEEGPVQLDRERLLPALRRYLGSCCPDYDWQAITCATDDRLSLCLAMICPLSPTEQQALLEAESSQARADMLTRLIELASHGSCTRTQ